MNPEEDHGTGLNRARAEKLPRPVRAGSLAEMKRPFPKSLWMIWLVLAVAVVLRFYHLGARPLYHDEPFHTVVPAINPPSLIVASNYGSILYPLLIHGLLPLGTATFMARLPAALFGILSVWLVFLIGKKLFGRKEAALAAFLTATSTYLIYYSQQARSYSGMVLLILCSLLFYLDALKTGRLRSWILFILFATLSGYMHLFSLVMIPVYVFFFAFELFKQRISKRPSPLTRVGYRNSVALVFSLAAIFVLVYFLYLPAKGQPASENLFLILPHSLRSIFRGELAVQPLSFTVSTLKILLGFYASPVFFFFKIALVFLGIFFGARGKPRELVLLLAGIFIPIVLFSLSNPPEIYLPADRKFIFLLPFLFLMMAKGATGFSSFIARRLVPGFIRGRRTEPERVTFVCLILLLVFGEFIFIRDFQVTTWTLTSFPLERKASDSVLRTIKDKGDQRIFSDDPAALLNFFTVRGISNMDRTREWLLFCEMGDPRQTTAVTTQTELWIVLKQSPLDEARIARWTSLSPDLEIRSFSRSTLLYLPSPDMPLWEKYAAAVRMVLDLPRSKDAEDAYHLFLSKVYLMAGKNLETERELDALRPEMSRFVRKEWLRGLKNRLTEEVFSFLNENASRAHREGRWDEAAKLWIKAMNLDPTNVEFRGRTLLSQADSYALNGDKAKAVDGYLRVLPFCQNLKDEEYVIEKIRNIRTAPHGYILWRRDNIWHLRWWSHRPLEFSGKIISADQVRGWQKIGLTRADSVTSAKNALEFRGRTLGGRVKGINIQLRSPTKLTLWLDIKGEANILDKVLIAGEPSRPVRMPFFLE